MLKHATINRTSRAQQTLQLQRQWQQRRHCLYLDGEQQHPEQPLQAEGDQLDALSSPSPSPSPSTVTTTTALATATGEPLAPSSGSLRAILDDLKNDNHLYQSPSPQLQPRASATPSPSLLSTLNKRQLASSPIAGKPNSAPATPQRSSSQIHHQMSPNARGVGTCNSESMIKVFARTLSQEVEYITLHVNTQTKSNQIIKSLLRKFRLKHRDPNLFHLTLERWIRKDGLKYKSVMLLGDEACPLQLQQCCSNPPHNDIKFTLQMRAGALVKIFCSDVVPDAQYKCLSLSTQTTVEETIELMLHCLGLTTSTATSSNISNTTITSNHHSHSSSSTGRNMRIGSPSSTGSSNSSSTSSASSSSGIESEPNSGQINNSSSDRAPPSVVTGTTMMASRQLDSDSRASSVTSISDTSNISSLSSSLADQYCMVIECKDNNFKRVLDSDEYLVDVYQSLLIEAKGQQSHEQSQSTGAPQTGSPVAIGNGLATATTNSDPINADQWFFLKLRRRDQITAQANNCISGNNVLKFTISRQQMPLPPIPLSTPQLGITAATNAAISSNLPSLVSTTQIEVARPPRPTLIGPGGVTSHAADVQCRSPALEPRPLPVRREPAPPPPAVICLVPPVRPRRRNLSNASSTFARPLAAVTSGSISRRRYDPAQLAEDLNRLDMNGGGGGLAEASGRVSSLTTTTLCHRRLQLEPNSILAQASPMF